MAVRPGQPHYNIHTKQPTHGRAGQATDAKSRLRRMWREEREGLRALGLGAGVGSADGDEDWDEEEEDDEEDEEIKTPDAEHEMQDIVGEPSAGKGTGKQRKRRDEIDADEVYELLRHITDPEHPLTLEQLAVVSRAQVHVYDPPEEAAVAGANGLATSPARPPRQGHVFVEFTPTIPHCSMATLIGLTLRVRLMRSLPARYKVDIRIKEGMHQSENAVNKQLNDKERVHAALENTHLLSVVEGCLGSADTGRVGEAPVAA